MSKKTTIIIATLTATLATAVVGCGYSVSQSREKTTIYYFYEDAGRKMA